MKDELQTVPRGRLHTVQLERRARAVMTGVVDVDSFNEAEVDLVTEDGFVTVSGRELHISRLSLEEGQLVVEGEIDGINYSEAPAREGGFLGRFFRG